MTSARVHRFRLADWVHGTIAPDRSITVHTEGRAVPAETIAVMVALGETPQPWYEVIMILRVWAQHAPALPAEDAVQYSQSSEHQRVTRASTMQVGDPLFPLAARDPSGEVRALVAKAATARAGEEDVVRLLAADPNWWVRACVATGRVVPVDVVDLLANDAHEPVQMHLAASMQLLSDDALRSLKSGSESVRNALQNRMNRGAY